MAMHKPAWRSSADASGGATGHKTTASGYDAYNNMTSAGHAPTLERHSRQHQQTHKMDRQQQNQGPWFEANPEVIAPVTNATQRVSTSSSSSSSSEHSATSRHKLHHRGYGDGSVSGEIDEIRVLVMFTFALELVILCGMAVFEYYLRVTDRFPIREVTFSCSDPDISYLPGQSTYNSFAYQAEVPYVAVVIICFCLPPFIISVAELALWLATAGEQKSITVLCRPFRVPLPFRRIVRFTGAFIFGILVTMIFVDVTKIMTGRLRPTFLNTCQPNMTLCAVDGRLQHAADVCSTSVDRNDIRAARQSFPSMQAAMTAFSACFTAVYLHNVLCAGHKARILRLFLSLGFMMTSVLCCLARYGLNYNHWVDVTVGFALGVIIAVYIGAFVLNNFRERLSGRRLLNELQRALGNDDELQVLPASWLSATPVGEIVDSVDAAGKPTTISYAWQPARAAIIIPRPRLKTIAEGPAHTAPPFNRTPGIEPGAGPWLNAVS